MKIYTLCCNQTKDIRYVGVTSRKLSERLYGHKHKSRKIMQTSLPVSKWINSINENVSIILLDEVDDEVWEITEQYWIEQLKQWGFNLLNLSKGGAGIVRGIRPNTIESKKQPIDMFTIDGKYIKTFSSSVKATIELGLKSNSSISNILNEYSKIPASAHKRKHFAGGYRWAISGGKPSPLIRFVVNDIVYLSLTKASKELHFCRNKSKQYLKGLRGPINGLRIKYDIV